MDAKRDGVSWVGGFALAYSHSVAYLGLFLKSLLAFRKNVTVYTKFSHNSPTFPHDLQIRLKIVHKYDLSSLFVRCRVCIGCGKVILSLYY